MSDREKPAGVIIIQGGGDPDELDLKLGRGGRATFSAVEECMVVKEKSRRS